MRTIESELELFKKTGNSAHARWIANELSKAISESGFAHIKKEQEVTVGQASGGEIRSGLLWAVNDLVEAKNRHLMAELEKERALNHHLKIRFNGVSMEKIKLAKESSDQMNSLFWEFIGNKKSSGVGLSAPGEIARKAYDEWQKASKSQFFANYTRQHHEELHGTFTNYPHKMQNEIMKEALQEIRNRGRKWPAAGEIAANALDKAAAVNA